MDHYFYQHILWKMLCHKVLNKCFTKYVTSLLNFLTAIKISKKSFHKKSARYDPLGLFWLNLIWEKNAAKSLNLELSH